MRTAVSRPTSLFGVVVLSILSACATFRGASATPHMTGSYAAKLQVSGRSTYVGTFSIAEWVSDSLRGSLRLVSPLAVDVVVGGRQIRDTLRLNGTYSAANGCTGTFAAPLVVSTDLAAATGPFTLVDKCAGTLTGQMELKR